MIFNRVIVCFWLKIQAVIYEIYKVSFSNAGWDFFIYNSEGRNI